jgi:hypothetical protein
MLNLSLVVRDLEKQRDRAKAEMERLEAALKVLGGWGISRKSVRQKMFAKLLF